LGSFPGRRYREHRHPLPGETILLSAAIYAGTTGQMNIAYVIGAAIAGAILGDTVG
jgi:membrane protein DedA with SNARE-associated domain